MKRFPKATVVALLILLAAQVCPVAICWPVPARAGVAEKFAVIKEPTVVVVDPGHGGKDSGAVSPWGLKEKDVVLKIAFMVEKILKRRSGFKVYLTRRRDRFLTLEERTAFANRVGADIFVSIHCNSSRSHRLHGVETFFLNWTKDPVAMAVAAKENSVDRKNMTDLQLILTDLMITSKIDRSQRLAIDIHKSLVASIKRSYRKVGDLGVRQGPFYVLMGASMPSVLVEVGFLSNRTEERRLRKSSYRWAVARGIVSGIVKFDRLLMMARR